MPEANEREVARGAAGVATRLEGPAPLGAGAAARSCSFLYKAGLAVTVRAI